MIKPTDVIRRTFDLPGLSRRELVWPVADKQLIAAVSQVDAIDQFAHLIKGKRVCVQAGGACGVWPLRLAQIFETVYTFEPLTLNFRCMSVNCFEADNIIMFNAALGVEHGMVHMEWPEEKADNFGAQFVRGGGIIPRMKIDNLFLPACDLIYLDIEGSELDALNGAAETVNEYKPVIVYEDKWHGARYGRTKEEIVSWLKVFGYTNAMKVYRDSVWVRE